MHVVFELRREDETSSGSMLIVNGAAALSALITNPDDLEEIAQHLPRWYEQQPNVSWLDPPPPDRPGPSTPK